MKISKKILVVVAHTDDEAIGMGGTIAKHVSAGDDVYCIAMTNGVSAREDITNNDIQSRKEAAKNAANKLGYTWIEQFDFPDNQLDSVPLIKVIQAIESSMDSLHPDIIYTHAAVDLNIDHKIVSQAVLTAFRPIIDDVQPEIRLFEVSSATDFGHRDVTGQFTPNLYVDITETWAKKEMALNAYDQEMRPFPHSRSIENLKNLAHLRGSQAGLMMAEAFTIIRRIER